MDRISNTDDSLARRTTTVVYAFTRKGIRDIIDCIHWLEYRNHFRFQHINPARQQQTSYWHQPTLRSSHITERNVVMVVWADGKI